MQRLTGQEEVVCLELYVKDASMPPMVLALATPTTYKELLKSNDGGSLPLHHPSNNICFADMVV